MSFLNSVIYNSKRYSERNKQLGLPSKNEHRVVFMGNSITEGWSTIFPEFFEGFGKFRKLREACGNNFHLMSCKSTSVVTSYDQKTKK